MIPPLDPPSPAMDHGPWTMDSVPHVSRITELDPRRRRLHVVGEVHPGELSARGYAPEGDEWVLELARPVSPGRDQDRLLVEFRVLRDLGYAFAEGDEWAPAEIFRHFRNAGFLPGDAVFLPRPTGGTSGV